MRVYLLPKPTEVTHLSVVLKGGAFAAPEGMSGLPALAQRLALEGTRSHPGGAFAQVVDELGAKLTTDSSWDASRLSLTVSKEDVLPGLRLLAEALTEPEFSSADFALHRAEWLELLDGERRSTETRALDVALRRIVGRRQGAPVHGTPREVASIERSHVLSYHRRTAVPHRAALVAVGALDPRAFLDAAEQVFGVWTAGEPKAEPVSVEAEEQVAGPFRAVCIDDPGAERSTVLLAQRLPPRFDPGQEAREALERIVGGLFTSRLNSTLRQKLGLTYRVASRRIETARWSALVVVVDVSTETAAVAAAELVREVHTLRDPRSRGAVRPDETRRARADLMLALAARYDDGARWNAAVAELFTYDLPDDYYEGYRERLRVLQQDAVLNEAARLRENPMAVVLVGECARIEPELRARGIPASLASPADLE